MAPRFRIRASDTVDNNAYVPSVTSSVSGKLIRWSLSNTHAYVCSMVRMTVRWSRAMPVFGPRWHSSGLSPAEVQGADQVQELARRTGLSYNRSDGNGFQPDDRA